ncbi:MAG: diguanylate cyclase [Deltaproteobacteria bacterium]|nr:diguanylate cyclase [Deltaproteobacteria bacterium]MBW2418226.1 diguanylate cyclase [Deltaproteobacteria bacterium]
MSESPAQLRRQPLTSVSTQIILFVFLSTFLTALIVSWISIHSTHTYLRKQIDRSFPALLERSRDDLEPWLGGLQSDLERLASSLELRRDDLAAVESLLRDQVEAKEALWDLTLLDASGQVLVRAIPDGAPPVAAWESQAAPGPLAFVPDASGTVALTLFAPLPGARLPETRQAGATLLAARLRSEALAARLERLGRGATGELLLIDAEGRSFFADGSSSAQIEERDQRRSSIARFAQGGPDLVHEYTNTRGEHVLGALLPLEATPLFLAVEAPFEEAFSPVLSVVTRVLISDLCIILLFSVVAFKITERMIRPIQALSEGARRISEGQTDHEIPDPGNNDELGLLTRAFNDMMRKLRRSHLEIEKAAERLRSQNEELHQANEVLSQLSITDGLTKLHNHRFFQDHLTREINRIARSGNALSMLMVDLDDFKQLNDRYGHAAGDEILVRVASIMSASVRDSDLLARYGGEEFVVLATNTAGTGAILLAEKIRMSVDQSVHIIDGSARPLRGVTVSIGVAEYHGDRKEFFRSADRALYRAKAQGKNCVITAEESLAPPPAPYGDAI